MFYGSLRFPRLRFAGAERGSRDSQGPLHIHYDRVRATKHAPRDPFSVLERRHGLAEIVECGAVVSVERLRIRTSAERDKREHYKRRAARLAKSPAHARRKSQPKTRKDEKIFPDGQDSVNVAGLGAEEHLAAIHADQFHRLLRADSFDDFQDM